MALAYVGMRYDRRIGQNTDGASACDRPMTDSQAAVPSSQSSAYHRHWHRPCSVQCDGRSAFRRRL